MLLHGEYNSTPPVLLVGKPHPVQLDINGNLITSSRGVYNATPPSLSDGDTSAPQLDPSGNHKITLATGLAGEDLTADRLKTEHRGSPFAISTATTTTVKSGAGFIYKIRVIGGTLGNVTIYDNTAASGTVLLPTVTPVQDGVLLENVSFATGLTIVTAAATIIVGSYR